MSSRTSPPTHTDLGEIQHLRAQLQATETRLAEAEEIIAAIRSGEVDAVVVSGPAGDQIFTLQGAEYAYRALVEEMSEGAATLGLDGTILYCNQRLSDLTQRPMEQVIGRQVFGIFSGEFQETFKALFFEARDGRAGSAELELESHDSKASPVYVSLRSMSSAHPVTLCMVVTDLKDKKKNDELLAAGRLATGILDSAAEAIAVCNQSGTIIKANEAFRILSNSNPVFQSFEKVLPLHEGGPQGKHFTVNEALMGSSIRALEVTFLSSDSQLKHLLLSASPIRSASTIIGCVFTITDVTDMKRAQAAVLRSEKLASVGRMASTIAHEINNPLEIIGQSIYLAITDPVISAEAKSYLELAAVELERVALITKQTLAFHRDNSTAKQIDLCELTDSVLRFFTPRLIARNITVKKRYSDLAFIHAFSGEIRQVISNLLSNSMDAVPNEGSIFLRISGVGNSAHGRSIRLLIADTGSGIPQSSLKTIFEPFFTTKEVVGTGLGLWVTKQIVEKHGARIQVRSKPGLGTVFAIDFPAAEHASTPIQSHSESRSS